MNENINFFTQYKCELFFKRIPNMNIFRLHNENIYF